MKPQLRWTVVDRSGMPQGQFEFGDAQKACEFLNEVGRYGPYRVQPLRDVAAA